MKIRITRTFKLNKNVMKNVITELSTTNGPMTFVEETRPIMFEIDEFDWDVFFDICSDYRHSNQYDNTDFLVVLTELRNNANWFSCFSETGERTIFIHACEWDNYIYAEPEFPIAYEVIANVLQSLLFNTLGYGFHELFHDNPIGCMNDMCAWKPDITFKLRTGDVCSDCLNVGNFTPN